MASLPLLLLSHSIVVALLLLELLLLAPLLTLMEVKSALVLLRLLHRSAVLVIRLLLRTRRAIGRRASQRHPARAPPSRRRIRTCIRTGTSSP